MSGSKTGFAFGAFVAGVGLGTAVTLLLAPCSGEEARELIAEKTRQGKDYIAQKAGSLKGQMKDSVKNAKDKIHEAVQTGKDVYREQVHDA